MKHLNVKPYDKLYAILSVDKNGNEGICVLNINGERFVAVTGEIENINLLKKNAIEAKQEAIAGGLKLVVAEFERVKTEQLI